MANSKYFEYKEAGLCVRCGGMRTEGKTRCGSCHLKHLEYSNKAKAKAIAKGNCRYCLINPATSGKSMCSECLEIHSGRQKTTYQNHRASCIEAYGGRCVCCGTSNQKYLQLDHIHGDGASHRKEIFGGRGGSIYTWAYRNDFPNLLQLLCANCHQAKTVYGGCDKSDHPPYIISIDSVQSFGASNDCQSVHALCEHTS